MERMTGGQSSTANTATTASSTADTPPGGGADTATDGGAQTSGARTRTDIDGSAEPSVSVTDGGSSTESSDRPGSRDGGRSISPYPFVIGGVGAALLIGGAITGALALACVHGAAGMSDGICVPRMEAAMVSRRNESTCLSCFRSV